MTKEWKGETVQMPEAFGIKSGKKPELWTEKSRTIVILRFPVKKEIGVRCWIDIDGGKFFGLFQII